MDTKLSLMIGVDIPIPECKLIAHQPTLRDIAFIGETDYFVGSQCLSVSKQMMIEDESLLANTTNFQVLMAILLSPQAKDQKQATLQVLKLLFPDYTILITPRALLFMKQDEDNVLIDESNFEQFQAVLKQIFSVTNGPMDQSAFNPADARSREIAQKLMRGRQRVAAQQGSGTQGSVFGRYISILTIGAHVDIIHLMKLTPYQLYDLLERYYLYTNWDLDVRTRLAGGTPDSKPEDWMKSIH